MCRLRVWSWWTSTLVLVTLCQSSCPAASQPLLNSLIPVLFRERPSSSWSNAYSKQPTAATIQFFPSSLRQVAPLVASGSSHQGILIAHPIITKNVPVRLRLPPAMHGTQELHSAHHQHHVTSSPFGFYKQPPPTTGQPPPEADPMSYGDEPQHQQQTEFHHQVDNSVTDEADHFGHSHATPSQHHSNNYAEFADHANYVPPPLDFRPSPQILAPEPFDFESDNTVYYNSYKASHEVSPKGSEERGFRPVLRYETGFQPSRGQQKLLFVATSAQNEFHHPWTNLSHAPSPSKKPKGKKSPPLRQDRQIVTAEVSKSVVTAEMSVEAASSTEGPVRRPVYRKPKHSSHNSSVTTASSSDRVEDWIKLGNSVDEDSPPKQSKVASLKSSLHFTRPVKCEFHRYGFCGVDTHYPKSDVDKIASRCYTLLTHIIAPQIKHNLATSVNGTIRERYSPGKRHNQRGWSWKTYQGSPMCNYLELTVTPGWAKDELGDWVVILQTQEWKQEAQVSICTSSKAECVGPACPKKSTAELLKTRCVQRFAAQRLAVLDPENQDRCPVIKSVFLPSSCICISAAAGGSAEQLDTSSSEVSHISNVMRPDSNDTSFMIVTEKFTVTN